MIHLAGPVILAAVLAGAGVYGLVARRNAVLVLVGAELLVAAAGVLFVAASALPAGGLAALERPGAPPGSVPAADPLLSGQVLTVFAVTIAAAEVGLAPRGDPAALPGAADQRPRRRARARARPRRPTPRTRPPPCRPACSLGAGPERGRAMSAASTAAVSTSCCRRSSPSSGCRSRVATPCGAGSGRCSAASATLAAALVEAWAVYTGGRATRIPFLGSLDLGSGRIALDLRADALSATVAVLVGLVALCVQVYSTAYLAELPDDPVEQAPTRYPAYAATVSLFTAAMMTVVHADDLVLLLLGLGGHGRLLLPARRAPQRARRRPRRRRQGLPRDAGRRPRRAARGRALLAATGTTSIPGVLAAAPALPPGTVLAAALLLLAGVAGKSAQFPLHTWLPDAMEGPTPVSALIHAATMVAAGVYLVVRLLPLFLAAPAALTVAAVDRRA